MPKWYMTKSPLIGTGFYSHPTDERSRIEFFCHWMERFEFERKIVVVNNSHVRRLPIAEQHNIHVIEIDNNLGHIGDHLGKFRPHLLGWSMSWIIPATIAYSEQRDFMYVEQDCLVFGEWEKAILDEAEAKGRMAMFGKGVASIAPCEQSLFWIHRDFITEFIYRYLSFPDGDGKMLPEAKFARMADADKRISTFELGVGRDRPLPYNASAWYAQHLTEEEMAELKERKLI